ncbi:peptidoglycan-binding domain-containing protein [Tropicimonas marinistellae]|uniref:peptidoglycan-binding domain-containing protein n=1 Tax=Tropicimonas marinistellae TaxID=1739787 RepID=UPI00082F9267|nr:peptidoglycan-binding domain-containing protein [Tropicimonas marinistellae]
MPALSRLLVLALLLAACEGSNDAPPIARLAPPAPVETRDADGPPDAAPDTCWGRAEVSENGQEGAIGEIWFQIPCPADLNPQTIPSLQRALAARGLYKGPSTGLLDQATRDAIRRYQSSFGIESDVLSLAAAQSLGLVPVSRSKNGLPADAP